MLDLPSRGVNRSLNKHNSDLTICCDWIEASVLFGSGEVSGSDIVDLLNEYEVYDTQDFAWEFVDIVFAAMRERVRVLGEGYPIRVQDGTRVIRLGIWQDYVAYSFCLVLSLSKVYPEWWRTFGPDYGPQGELFEALTAESVTATFAGWEVHRTGWSTTKTNRLTAIVADVSSLLGEVTGDVVRWSARKAKEAGLDLLCFRPFADGRVGIPVFMFQCASGGDWPTKLHAPEMRVWTKLISFASEPKKAFAMPFALEREDFTYHCNLVNGLLLDRDRLLAPGHSGRDWVSDDLSARLRHWIGPRLGTLPTIAET